MIISLLKFTNGHEFKISYHIYKRLKVILGTLYQI